jgi:hypothetical protein
MKQENPAPFSRAQEKPRYAEWPDDAQKQAHAPRFPIMRRQPRIIALSLHCGDDPKRITVAHTAAHCWISSNLSCLRQLP